jgi:putative transposase
LGTWFKKLDIQNIALERYKTIEPFLQRNATLEDISKEKKIPVRTPYNWAKAFKQNGLNGVATKRRSDKGQRRAADVCSNRSHNLIQ